MTPAELMALAQQLLYDCCDPVTGEPLYTGQSSYACVEDVEAAAHYLRDCAEAEPVATVRVHDTGGNAGIAWTGVPTENSGVMRGGTPLYTRPQPPSEQAEVANDSKWLGPFTTASEALNELRMAIATMMGCDQSTWPDHGNAPLAIAAAFAIRQTALEERAPEQDDVRAAPQPPSTQAEPVAWRITDGEGGYDYRDDPPEDWQVAWAARWGRKHEPLYTQPHPQPPSAQADAVEALRELVDALDGAFISSWQSTAAWQTQLDRARAALATRGGGNA